MVRYDPNLHRRLALRRRDPGLVLAEDAMSVWCQWDVCCDMCFARFGELNGTEPFREDVVKAARSDGWSVGRTVKCPDCRKAKNGSDKT